MAGAACGRVLAGRWPHCGWLMPSEGCQPAGSPTVGGSYPVWQPPWLHVASCAVPLVTVGPGCGCGTEPPPVPLWGSAGFGDSEQ